jgi:hypothetical protein
MTFIFQYKRELFINFSILLISIVKKTSQEIACEIAICDHKVVKQVHLH